MSMTMKRKDMTKAQLATEATAVKLPGRSKLTQGELAQALNSAEEVARMKRFPGDQPLTPKQRRRVAQKMNRQR